MNPSFIWQSKHLGLGVGIVLSGLGFFLAVPENMNTWTKVQKTYTIGDFEFQDTTYIRTNESVLNGYLVVELIPGKTEYKALGTGLMFLGSVLSLCFSSILKKEYERIEQSNYRLRQSEFELEDLHRDQNVEVQRWAIELDAQSDIRDMINPPVQYLQDSEEDEETNNDTFSETSTGFIGWITAKKPNLSQFKVIELCKLRFNKRLLKADEIRKWIDELVTSEVAEWLDDKKSEFRLLNN